MTAAGQMSAEREETDRKFLDAAYRYGVRAAGTSAPNPAVGAVIVRDTGRGPQIVGRGWTARGGRPHAEVNALNDAGDLARGAACYVSLEPCAHEGKTPPCTSALIKAGIARVIAPGTDQDERVCGRGFQQLRDAGVEVTLLRDAARFQRVHAGHFSMIRNASPALTLKLAISKNRLMGSRDEEIPITGSEIKRHVYRMRAGHDGILTGIGTVRVDDPQLTCRLPGMADYSPARIVLDPSCSLSPDSLLAKSARDVPVTVLAAEGHDGDNARKLRNSGVDVIALKSSGRVIPMDELLKALGSLGLTDILVEAGPGLAGFFLNERPASLLRVIVSEAPDELHVARPVAAPDGLSPILAGADADFQVAHRQSVGKDTLSIHERKVR